MPGSGSANDYAAGGYYGAPADVRAPSRDSTVGVTTQYEKGTPYYDEATGYDPSAPAGIPAGAGGGLVGALPDVRGYNADQTFAWSYSPSTSAYGDQAEFTNLTMAGALGYLKELSVNNKDQYNEVIGTLVKAGYITPAQARYNAWSTDMGAAFLRSAVDVAQVNQGHSAGELTTWWNYMDQTIQGRIESGQLNPDGSMGGSGLGRAALVRVDKYTPIQNVQNAIQNASEAALGRRLSDDEVKAFASAYHGLESDWNAANWDAKQKDPNESYMYATTTHPDVTAQAQNYMDTSPQFTQERDDQRVGSYVGILRDMMGLSPMPRAGISNQLLNQ